MMIVRILQAIIFTFTMLLMLSKEFEMLSFLSFLYESDFSVLCLIFGAISIAHGLVLFFISLGGKE